MHWYTQIWLQPELTQVTSAHGVHSPVAPGPCGSGGHGQPLGVGIVSAPLPMSQPVAVKTTELTTARMVLSNISRRVIDLAPSPLDRSPKRSAAGHHRAAIPRRPEE